MTAPAHAVAADRVVVVPPTATDQAWDQVRAELLVFVERRVEHRDAAEDIVQDVLERMHHADLAQVGNIQAWLYRSARNAIIDHYRRRRPTDSLDMTEYPIADPDAHVNDDGVGGGPAAVVQELARCLRPMVDRLPPDYRQAVTLVDLDGYAQHRAAEMVGISTSGMKSRVQRGRRKLGGLLQQCCTVATTPSGAIEDYAPRPGGCPC